jgi:hypothetical protein
MIAIGYCFPQDLRSLFSNDRSNYRDAVKTGVLNTDREQQSLGISQFEYQVLLITSTVRTTTTGTPTTHT